VLESDQGDVPALNNVITLSGGQVRTIEEAARAQGQTSDTLLADLIEELRDPRSNPRHCETDAWLRHLGMRDETLREIDSAMRSEQECPHDANA
jgi:hypothetical protein